MTDTVTLAETKVMTLVYIKEQYSQHIQAITLIDNEDIADAIAALLERTGAKVECIDVPIWPNMRKEGDQ